MTKNTLAGMAKAGTLFGGSSTAKAMKPDYAIVLGRFQPLHFGHVDLIQAALTKANRVLVIIGSHNEATTFKNPFWSGMRQAMLENTFASDIERITFTTLEDYTYRDETWGEKFKKVVQANSNASRVFMIHDKDDGTSFCVRTIANHFPSAPLIKHKATCSFDATTIREAYFGGMDLDLIPGLPAPVKPALRAFRLTQQYTDLAAEKKALAAYKASWASAPFPPHFVAVDNVVVWRDDWGKPYFLVGRRKSEFGDGKLAIPGGYLEVAETILESAKRELLEETGLAIAPSTLLVEVRVYDAPYRSARGRMITHVHVWNAKSNIKPVVKGGDDLSEAFWLPFDEVYRNKAKFFADHYYIISDLFPEVEKYK